MHVEAVEEQVRLVAHTLTQALKLGLLEVSIEDRLVHIVGALVNDHAGSLAGSQTANVGKTSFGNHNVQVVLSLINVSAHGDNARDTVGVRLGGTSRGSVHDGVLGVSQEISRATETVEHTGAHDAGRVGVSVNVNLDGGVHADDTKATDDLGGVGHLLRAEKKLVLVGLPVLVEALEAVGGEADRGSGGEVEAARVKKIKEGILDDLGPHLEVAEVGVVQTTNDGIGYVADTGLERKEVLGKTAVLHLVLKELNQVTGNLLRALIGRGVGGGLILVVGLDDTNNLLGVDGDRVGTNAVLDLGDQVGLAAGRKIGHGDVVQAIEARERGVDLNNDLKHKMSVRC